MNKDPLFSLASTSETGMHKVYDLALLLHELLSRREGVSNDEQAAMTWLTADLMKIGLNLQGYSEALYEAARQEKGQDANAIVETPGASFSFIDPDKLTFSGMFALYDALGTIHDVLSGLASQPRFTDGVELPPHGDMLQQLDEFVANERERLYNAALAREPKSRGDRERKFFFLADRYVDGLTSPEYAIAELASEVDRMRQKKGGAS